MIGLTLISKFVFVWNLDTLPTRSEHVWLCDYHNQIGSSNELRSENFSLALDTKGKKSSPEAKQKEKFPLPSCPCPGAKGDEKKFLFSFTLGHIIIASNQNVRGEMKAISTMKILCAHNAQDPLDEGKVSEKLENFSSFLFVVLSPPLSGHFFLPSHGKLWYFT